MQVLIKLAKDRRLHRLALIGMLILMAIIVAIWKFQIGLQDLKGYWQVILAFLAAHGLVLFIALVVLPAFPVPLSPLLILAGVAWKDHPYLGCLICVFALMLNMIWSYYVAAVGARKWIGSMIESYGIRIPQESPKRPLQWILLMRLTPGMPFFIQNSVLGFIRVPFKKYLGWSLLCNGFLSSGVILGASGISSGNYLPGLIGIALILVSVLVIQWFRRHRLEKTHPVA